MSKEKRDAGALIGIATFVGGVIGLTTGLILAPRSGKKTQAMIKDTLDNVVDNASNLTETINEKANGLYSRGVDEVAEMPGQVKAELSNTAREAQDLYNSSIESGKAYVEDIKNTVLSSINEVRRKFQKEKVKISES